MQMITKVETKWHDPGVVTIVPAGEPVQMVDIEKVPTPDRWYLSDSLTAHARRGEEFVPVRIRDWWAIVARRDLAYPPPPAPAPKVPKTKVEPLKMTPAKPKKTLFDSVPQ